MKRKSRLSLALHTLGHMASDPSRIRTSAEIAEHAGTNPVVVRRVLAPLREGGLLKSENGHAGGWSLTRAPQEITLADVYLALGEQLIASDDTQEKSSCAVETSVHSKVTSVLDGLERQFVDKLASIRISEIE